MVCYTWFCNRFLRRVYTESCDVLQVCIECYKFERFLQHQQKIDAVLHTVLGLTWAYIYDTPYLFVSAGAGDNPGSVIVAGASVPSPATSPQD